MPKPNLTELEPLDIMRLVAALKTERSHLIRQRDGIIKRREYAFKHGRTAEEAEATKHTDMYNRTIMRSDKLIGMLENVSREELVFNEWEE